MVILRKRYVVAIIESLNRRGMSSSRHMDNSQRLEGRSQHSIWIALYHFRRHDLFSGIYDAARRQGGFLADPKPTPGMGPSLRIRALNMDDSDIWMECAYQQMRLTIQRRCHQPYTRMASRDITSEEGAHRYVWHTKRAGQQG